MKNHHCLAKTSKKHITSVSYQYPPVLRGLLIPYALTINHQSKNSSTTARLQGKGKSWLYSGFQGLQGKNVLTKQ